MNISLMTRAAGALTAIDLSTADLNALADELREAIKQHYADAKRDEERYGHGKANAAAWAESIGELVAALNCDYDRLEELRDERAALAEALKDADSERMEASTDEDLEGAQVAAEAAREALADWDEENGEELRELTAAATIEGEVQTDAEAVRERIQEAPLSVEVRGDWVTPGDRDDHGMDPPSEFRILLSTGGPALQIRGELNEHCEPCRAWLEYQDWGTPWTQFYDVEQDTLLAFCREFYFGG